MIHTISCHTFIICQQKLCITGSSLLVQFLVSDATCHAVVLHLEIKRVTEVINFLTALYLNPFLLWDTNELTLGMHLRKLTPTNFIFHHKNATVTWKPTKLCFYRTRVANIYKLAPVEEAHCHADGWRKSARFSHFWSSVKQLDRIFLRLRFYCMPVNIALV